MADDMDKELGAAVDKATGMVSMKRTKKEKKKDSDVCCAPGDEETFPWGLRLRLEEESLTKLKMDLPKVGSNVKIEAIGKVVEVSQHESDKRTNRHVEIQIQKLSVS
jgi:hypothetical protein